MYVTVSFGATYYEVHWWNDVNTDAEGLCHYTVCVLHYKRHCRLKCVLLDFQSKCGAILCIPV